MSTSITTTLIAASSAIVGVLIKTIYDWAIERLKRRKEHDEKFISERKDLYDGFLRTHREVCNYQQRLRDLMLIVRAGRAVKPGVISDFPDSPLPRLTVQLEEIRRLAHSIEIIKNAEQMVALRGDATTALRVFLWEDGETYGLPLFIANRLSEDQELEFISAYRKELSIGPPKGGPKNYPIVDRPWPAAFSHAHLQTFLKYGFGSDSDEFDYSEGVSKKLTRQDIELLESPRLRELLQGDEQ